MKKNALITGLSGGVGKSLSKKLIDKNYDVFGISRNFENNNSIGKNIKFIKADLSNSSEINYLVENEISSLDFDLLIHSAGVFKIKKIQDYSMNEIEKDLMVNLTSLIKITSAIVPNMIRKRNGMIIFIGSSSSYSGYKNTSLYCASKHALLGFSRSLADELRQYGIRVSCICPGTIDTKMSKELEKTQNKETFISVNEFSDYVLDLITSNLRTMWLEEIQIKRIKYD